MLITVWHAWCSFLFLISVWLKLVPQRGPQQSRFFPIQSSVHLLRSPRWAHLDDRGCLCTWPSRWYIHRLSSARNWMKKSLKISCWPGLSHPNEVILLYRSQLKVCHTLFQETSRGLPATGANWKSQNSSWTKIEQKHEYCLTCLRCHLTVE